ncbi:PHD finger protein 20 [Rhypophila decipiens]|uniref:PHD finger protein 20 n=1 Tax=Rhypophila decipiens TaxID=261697 RepID=A0AAN6YCG3_9PEZI|nr:PHD finger protein 20 [Rhypophila decipiens]
MSGDQQASSFGDPNAQPPTPKQTPTSSVFPSSVFETPKNNQGRFDESGGWTPRFAEEYSVFNTTPGNLRGTQGPFPEFVPASPFTPISANQKRPLSAEGLAVEIASHANHFSPNPNLLPPVEPSRQLGSSPSPVFKTPTTNRSVATTEPSSPTVERSKKKARHNTADQESQGQTATPPPTARKGERKLAPKLDTGAMQNDHGFGQPDFMGTPRQGGMGNFVTTPSDMFGYPMSAPATASGFTSQRPFWDDPNMAGMDIDFSTNGNNGFQNQNQAGQGTMEAVQWRSNQVFQGAGLLEGQNQEGVSTSELDRTFVSQARLQSLVSSSMDQSLFVANFPTSADDPFGISNGGGVDPGLLFSRPQSSNLHASFNMSIQMQDAAEMSVSQGAPVSQQGSMARTELRRSASAKDVSRGKQKQAPASSPIKPSARPGLSRSFSENRGRRSVGRSSLPTLAPAPRPQSQLVGNAGVGANRPVVSQPTRPSGRSSPLKNQHQRLSSLSSIPEMPGPRTRTEAKFTIDANGRARVETTIVVEDDGPPTVRKRHSALPTVSLRHHQWTSTDDDDSSSTDDEPIIIPSRNTSFALPDPRKPSTTHPFHNSQRSISERSTTSHSSFRGGSQDDYDSDQETLRNDITPTGNKPSGDAASELRKLRQKRPRPLSASKRRHRLLSGDQGPPSTTAGFAGHYPGHNTTSPTTLTDTSLPTPSSSDSRIQRIRCVCNRPDVDRGDDFLVQCNSCEMQLHGRCVNMTEPNPTSMYICAFCADTPNARSRPRVGSSRNSGRRMSGPMGPPNSLTSPLAHKSGFKYFR